MRYLLAMCLCLSLAHGATVYVKSDATGKNNGTSWTDAYTTIKAALQQNLPAGTEIWVTKNTYPGSIVLKPTISLYGGFLGTETSKDKRDKKRNRTTITSADQWVVTFANTIIDGFVITGGKHGILAKTPGVISNCIICQNSSTEDAGGIMVDNASPIIINCIIKENTAKSGGGIYIKSGTPSVNSCVIQNNTATTNGGGILNLGAPTFTNCVFVGNTGTAGGWGSAIYNLNSTVTLTNCTFYGQTGNTVTNHKLTNNGVANFYNCIVYGGNIQNVGGSYYTKNCYIQPIATRAVADQPLFVNPTNPTGSDGIFGTADDGLMLTSYNSCIKAGLASVAPKVDIIGNTRSAPPDVGAYQYTGPAHVNSAPVIDSWSCPDSGKTGETLTFSASASDADGDQVTINWDFGDGTSATGPTASHVYTISGPFVVRVSATDGALATAAQKTVTLTSQNDGGGNQNQTLIAKIFIKLSFTGNNVDEINVMGALPMPSSGFNGKKFIIMIGGFQKTFLLNQNGLGTVVGGGSATNNRLSVINGSNYQDGTAKFDMRLKYQNSYAAMANLGLVNDTVIKNIAIPFTVTLGTDKYTSSVKVTYQAQKGKLGYVNWDSGAWWLPSN